MLNLPKNIVVMAFSMSLSFAIVYMMVLILGIIGTRIAPSPELATLPMAMLIVGSAIATIPAALIMQKLGRKAGMSVGLGLALLGAGVGFYATMHNHFTLLIIASVLFGFNAAFTQQGRFIILENAHNEHQAADGLTLALMANLLAAFVGPELGSLGEHLFSTNAGFAGSFLYAGLLILASLGILMMYQNIPSAQQQHAAPERPLSAIIKQPLFILAAGSAAVGYGVMSLIMTATPLSMHDVDGHSLHHTKLVIQSHIAAMFLPSLLSGALLKRGFRRQLIVIGLIIYLVVVLIGYSGAQVMHYWWALLLLGIGWNLLFMASTALLPSTYQAEEKFKAQACNDFLVFGFQAVAAFFAGWLLYNLSWSGLLSIALMITVVWLMIIGILMLKQRSTKPEKSS